MEKYPDRFIFRDEDITVLSTRRRWQKDFRELVWKRVAGKIPCSLEKTPDNEVETVIRKGPDGSCYFFMINWNRKPAWIDADLKLGKGKYKMIRLSFSESQPLTQQLTSINSAGTEKIRTVLSSGEIVALVFSPHE